MSTQNPTAGQPGDAEVDPSRRTWLTLTCGAGAALGAAVAAPFILSFAPSERAKAAGAPVEVDIADLKPGQLKTVEWRGKPVWLLKRDAAMLESLKKTDSMVADPKSDRAGMTPAYAKNETRSRKEDLLVVIGICTHLGCSPNARFAAGAQAGLPDDWQGGFLCPCHGSTFDLAGRVFKNKPAPDNLEVPPHVYLSDTKLLIGEDTKA
ncbi:ubiquinol-cytochrome c reductase iron-sulfur subunit [Derxia lacustris]|uniref:ubiquinol-cytochrome c reductase iron-sulfur subunit n=1 Tax=Derxia lacustris TaxID=764842 RepID=UPI000A16CC65|nr:ubiquinol-cytochrome c reductase iron-sulfur subunit [Derxia lacustris]